MTTAGSHSNFTTDTASNQYRIFNDICNSSVFTGVGSAAHVSANFHRFMMIGFISQNEAVIRSSVCYKDGPRYRTVNVDSQLTNWR